MATQSETVGNGAQADEVAFGLEAKVAAALAYFSLFGLILLFVEDDNDYVRFHAGQSVAFGFGLFIAYFVLNMFMGMFLRTILFSGGFALWNLISTLLMLINLVTLIGLLFMAYKAYQGEMFEMPIFADVGRSIEQAL